MDGGSAGRKSAPAFAALRPSLAVENAGAFFGLLAFQMLLELAELEQVAVVAVGIAGCLLADVDAVVARGTAPANQRLRVVRIVDRHDAIHRKPIGRELVALDD